MVDGCDFTLSQLLDTVETDIRIKNSLGQLGNLNISGFLICLLICISGMKILVFETIYFDLGIFSRKNSLGRNEIKTFNCVNVLQNQRLAKALSDNDQQQLIDSQTNRNTRINTKWSVEMLNKWRLSRENVPCMKEMNVEMLIYQIQHFVLKIRKQDDSEYPPLTLCFIGCGLLRHMQEENVYVMNFLDEQDHCFSVFRKVLNARIKELLSKGLKYQSKTSLSDIIGKRGKNLDWWSIRVRLFSSSTVYTFL